MEERMRLHAIVSGIVQGVSFRHHTRREAQRLLLTGWVRNRPDGTVEVVAEGSRAQLERLLAFLQVGPPAARVSGVEATWERGSGEFTAFEIKG